MNPPFKILAGNTTIPGAAVVKGTLTQLEQVFSCHCITFSPSLLAWVAADSQMGMFPLGTDPRGFISLPKFQYTACHSGSLLLTGVLKDLLQLSTENTRKLTVARFQDQYSRSIPEH